MRIKATTITPTVLGLVALVMSTQTADADGSLERVQAQANFQEADSDKNGQLNQAEFNTFIKLNADHKLGQAARIRRFGMHAQAFKKADADGDGVVTKKEIAAQAQP